MYKLQEFIKLQSSYWDYKKIHKIGILVKFLNPKDKRKPLHMIPD